MPRRFRKSATVALAWCLLLPLTGLAALAQQTRPRRVTGQPVRTPPPELEEDSKPSPPPAMGGPEIRVGLMSDATELTIRGDGPLLLNPRDPGSDGVITGSQVKLAVRKPGERARTSRGSEYQIRVASFKSREEADRASKKLRDKYSGKIRVETDPQSNSYELRYGSYEDRDQAENTVRILRKEGYKRAAVTSANIVVRAASVPMVSAITSRGRDLVQSRDSLAIKPAIEGPSVTVGGKPYRGRIEVSLNAANKLTVVNVLPLEEYLRGVVPQELSPTGFPAIEALKAQAIAARTYALKNRGQFANQGFDVLPTAASQVYGGRSAENSLSDRAIDETRGVAATYNGEPILAYFGSTCGGHTEDVENVFTGQNFAYLRGVACTMQSPITEKYVVSTERTIPENLESGFLPSVALMSVFGVVKFEDLTETYLRDEAQDDEIVRWADRLLASAGLNSPRKPKGRLSETGEISKYLTDAFFGDDNEGRLLTQADADYILGPEESKNIPAAQRSSVAFLLSKGILQFDTGGRLTGASFSRAEMFLILARIVRYKGAPFLRTATARASAGNKLAIRADKDTAKTVLLDRKSFLFRVVSSRQVPASSANIVGGETLRYHLGDDGTIDYLEVEPNPNGAANDRFSQFSYWRLDYSPRELASRFKKNNLDVGELIDILPVRLGVSNRVAELEIRGSSGEKTLKGFQIRSALGVRDDLFVIRRELNDDRRVVQFHIVGRGWGHGVGLCQVGAYGMAVEGYTAEQILKHYYSGIELTKMY